MQTILKSLTRSLYSLTWQVARAFLALLLLGGILMQAPSGVVRAAPLAGNGPLTSTTIDYVSPEPSGVGKTVTVGYHVSYTSGPLFGIVSIYENGSRFASCSSSQVPTGSCTLVFSAPGTYSLTASYEDTISPTPHDPSTSAPVTHTVVDIAEMDLFQGGAAIASGGSYGVGSQRLNTNTDTVFTIANSGTIDLTVDPSIAIGGVNADQFSLQAQPASPVAASGSTTFTLRFTPTSVGVKTATISIANNDSDENPYTFAIQGAGITIPEMDVRGGVSISNGDVTPSLSDATDFGSADAGSGVVEHTFSIENQGPDSLNLTGTPGVVVSGADASDFSVTAQPVSPVAASGSTTFSVRFAPSAIGLRSATLSIANDDSDENPYSFSIQGTGNCANAITVANANNSGPGSLRQAIASVCDGGTINFDADYPITLSSELSIDKDLTINGTGHNVTISGGGLTRVFYVSNVEATLENMTISNGKITGGGGGIYLYYGTVNISGSTISGNTATDAVYSGGGIYNYYGTLNISDSTFSGNMSTNNGGSGGSGGGIYNNSGTVNINNSTFSGNIATDASGGGSGGGIYNNYGTLKISNSTFSGNTATISNGGNAGGAILNLGFAATLKNTIVANNPSSPNCSGTLTDGGNNLEWGAGVSSTICGFATTSADPKLSVLSNYGGPTPTFALLPGSAAINAGSNCLSADQRGMSRVGTCDIGAFESQGFTLAKTGGDNQSAVINTTFTNPLTVSVTSAFGEPVNGGVVTFTPPGSGASAVITGSPATISGGAVSVSATANSTAGAYNVITSAAGAASVNFALTNKGATPIITWANPANIVSGTALGGAQLNATANVAGAFIYTPAAGVILPVGTHSLHVDFTPADTVNYIPTSKDVSITVTSGGGGGGGGGLVPTIIASDGTYLDKVNVTWTPVSGASYYLVYRSESLGGVKIPTSGYRAASLGGDDVWTNPGVTYYYWVRACDASGCGDFSAPDTGWQGLPAPVVTASDGTFPDKVQVTFPAVSGATSYLAYRSLSQDGVKIPTDGYFTIVPGGDDLWAAPGVTYYYWVKACNGPNCSTLSAYDTGWR